MKILQEKLTPFIGIGKIKLMSLLDDVKKILKDNNVNFTIENQSNKGCNPEVPWIMLHIENSITLSFAKNKLWEIYCEGDFSGELPNGIKIGMPLDEALKIDPSLKFDDWNEEFESSEGYWVEDNLDDNAVMSITIFIKEVLDDDTFFRYEW